MGRTASAWALPEAEMGGFPFTRDGAFGCNWSTWARSRHHLSPGTQRGTGNATRSAGRSAASAPALRAGRIAGSGPAGCVGAGRAAGWEPAALQLWLRLRRCQTSPGRAFRAAGLSRGAGRSRPRRGAGSRGRLPWKASPRRVRPRPPLRSFSERRWRAPCLRGT